MAYEIIWFPHTVVVKLTSSVTVQDLHAVNDSISGDPRFDDLHKRIFNCIDSPEIEISTWDLQIFAHTDNASAKSNVKIDTAIVATDPVLIQNTNQYISACQGFSWQVKLFTSLTDALEWDPHKIS